VNGRGRAVEVDPATPLLTVLRNDLGLTGAKLGCGLEQCGACAVLVDGKAVLSCVTPVEAFVGRDVVTIEGLADERGLHPLQRAFVEEQAAQCGYCVPGVIVAAKALLDRTPHPTQEEVRLALELHLCRCGAQPRMLRAILRAAGELRS
jgi:nicotinate dehydrogenase subunit A